MVVLEVITDLLGFQSTWGKLYKYFPLKLWFLIAMLVFEVGSLVLGVAQNPTTLIVGRAVSGVGGSGVAVGAFTMLGFAAPSEKRPQLLGFTGATNGIAAVLGPLIGGAFTDKVTCVGQCFYINLPIGGLAALIVFIFFRVPHTAKPAQASMREKLLQLNIAGAGLMMSLIVCYILALQYAGQTHSWKSGQDIELLVGFVAIVAVFVSWEIFWHSYDPTTLATPEAFTSNPELVWQFCSHRRHFAMLAQPNLAHYALAEASRRKPGLLTLSQNIDDLSERAGHPEEQILHLHGSLFRSQCVDSQNCGYSTSGTAERSQMQQDQDISGPYTSPDPPFQTLPTCPNCTKLLRPGVVWLGEPLPREVLATIRNWFDSNAKVDLKLVIGTSAQVYPAAGYINVARLKGARVCVVNTDRDHESNGGLHEDDWFFQGDAAVVFPTLLQPIIGLQGSTESI